MKFLCKRKDGGPESKVTGYWLVEIKSLFSIVLLKFENGSRDAYHTHAFNCFSWVLGGFLRERFLYGEVRYHAPGVMPFTTRRDHFHMVRSVGTTWVLSFRGPWAPTWQEYIIATNKTTTLKDGRVEVL